MICRNLYSESGEFYSGDRPGILIRSRVGDFIYSDPKDDGDGKLRRFVGSLFDYTRYLGRYPIGSYIKDIKFEGD
jgi:hypothetical protein